MATQAPGLPPVYMGFVGFVRLIGTTIEGDNLVNPESNVTFPNYLIRATSADINLKQEVSKPEVIDSRYDPTVYQLGPREIDGTLDFPAIYDAPEDENTPGIFEVLYRLAVTRAAKTGLLTPVNLEVKYAPSETTPDNQSEFLYKGCIINTWTFSVEQQSVVNCNISIIGTSREFAGSLNAPARKDTGVCDLGGDPLIGTLGNARIVTWNDARVQIVSNGGRLKKDIEGSYIRTFEATVDNAAERFYTLNRSLFPQAVAPRKRDVSGNLTIVGRHPDLVDLPENNQDECNEVTQIKFGFESALSAETCNNAPSFGVTLPNIVFSIEEMSLSNDIFESSMAWTSLPGAGTGVCDPLLTSVGATNFDLITNN